MKKKKLLWSALLLLVLGACDTAVQQVADNGKQTVVQFTSVVEGDAVTRTTGSSWTANDRIGVFMKQAGETLGGSTIVGEIAPVIAQIYHSLTGGREQLAVSYEPNVSADRFDEILFLNREREIRQKTTLTGPHRDDIRFRVQNMATGQTTDIRTFGSQGQQRSAALALKLAEIEIVKRKVNDTPVLLLDDVLSELDSSRQNYLLDSIHDIQTFITCTGLEEFVRHRFHMDQIYHVERGVVTRVNSLNSETIF